MDHVPKKGEYSPELLSPAGDAACLDAALSAGCDAVYAGVLRYGARAYAGNFTEEEFLSAINRCHLFGRKLYLTLNTLIKPDEFDGLYSLVKPLYEEGLDGVIAQDMGVISMLHESFPDLPLHASTQMSISSSYGASLLKNAGVSRIVPSRELSLPELKAMKNETGLELECFIHGAMCYSYSGMCLMSAFLGGRSGNRGRCAGPCRQPYSAGRVHDSYLLSMKDMCTIDILDELIGCGIDSFKIEGRMKSPAYVYGVTEIYRRSIDRILEHPERKYQAQGADRERLVSLYSRGGIETGYYKRHNGLSLITLEKGSYKREDTSSEHIATKRYPLRAAFYAACGEEAELTLASVSDPALTVTCRGDVVQSAKTKPMTKADLIFHLDKTGSSDFCFEDVSVQLDDGCFIRVGAINDLRRRALDMMTGRITDGYKRSM